jgi:Zn-dependent peptidase ImmA (M78 family)
MFVYTDELGGCIAVNANHPEDKRRMTLVHDYWHFLTERFRPDITLDGTQRRLSHVERAAEAFARNFLMPATGLTRRFQAMKRTKDGPMTPADLLALAAMYGVSFQALCWRLEELGLLPAGTWEALKDRGFQVQKARAIVGIPELTPVRSVLPLRYEALAVEAYEKELLTMEELAQYLQTDIVGARERVEELTGAHFVADGEWRHVALDLATPLGPAGS